MASPTTTFQLLTRQMYREPRLTLGDKKRFVVRSASAPNMLSIVVSAERWMSPAIER